MFNVIAQNQLERFLKQMSGGVIAHGGFSDHRRHFRRDRFSDFHAALGHFSIMNMTAEASFFAIRHLDFSVIGKDSSDVADLPAAFGIERRLIQKDEHILPFVNGICERFARDKSQNFTFR